MGRRLRPRECGNSGGWYMSGRDLDGHKATLPRKLPQAPNKPSEFNLVRLQNPQTVYFIILALLLETWLFRPPNSYGRAVRRSSTRLAHRTEDFATLLWPPRY